MTSARFKNTTSTAPDPIRATVYFRLLVVAAVFLSIAVWMDHWIRGELGVGEKIIEIARDEWGMGVLAAGAAIYILLLSLPFVPGMELGILLMCAFGKEGIVFVYIATVIGLVIAYSMGRMLPKTWVESRSKKLGFSQFGGSRSDEIISVLDKFFHNKKRLSALFLNHRYLVIGLLLNMPGAYIIGGGGGISFACGMSRNISSKLFLLTVVLGVLPVPLLAFLGIIHLEAFFHHLF